MGVSQGGVGGNKDGAAVMSLSAGGGEVAGGRGHVGGDSFFFFFVYGYFLRFNYDTQLFLRSKVMLFCVLQFTFYANALLTELSLTFNKRSCNPGHHCSKKRKKRKPSQANLFHMTTH